MSKTIIQLNQVAKELKQWFPTLESQVYWLNAMKDLKDSEKGYILKILKG